MEATAWVAIAGIGGTLLAPLLTERMRRASVRNERLFTQRLVVYAELLQATGCLADNALTWSSLPVADLKETDAAALDRLISQARVVASDDVYKHLSELTRRIHEFHRLLVMEAQPFHRQLRDEGKADDAESIGVRMRLGEVAEKVSESHRELELTIRHELRK